MRTLVDIPDDDIKKLDEMAGQEQRSRAAEIREAIRLHIARKSSNDWIRHGAGHWKGRTDLGLPVRGDQIAREDRGVD